MGNYPYRRLSDGESVPPDRRQLLLALLLLVLVAILVASNFDIGDIAVSLVRQAADAYDESPFAVAAITAAMFSLWIVVFLPTTLTELAIGFVFGLKIGYFVDLFGKYAGCALSYWLGRGVLRSCVRQALYGRGGGGSDTASGSSAISGSRGRSGGGSGGRGVGGRGVGGGGGISGGSRGGGCLGDGSGGAAATASRSPSGVQIIRPPRTADRRHATSSQQSDNDGGSGGDSGGGGSDNILSIFEEEAAKRPWFTALLMRAAWLPMPLKNYGQAVLGVPPLPFFGTLLPLELFDTYLMVAIGSSAKDLASLLRGEVRGEDATEAWIHLALLGVAVLATGGLLAFIGHVAMRAINAKRAERRSTQSNTQPTFPLV